MTKSPTPASAGAIRTRRLRWGVLTGIVMRAASLLSPFLIIPIALDALGKETYGVWMTVTALTSMMLWADLGLGNGLLTKVSHAVATGDYRDARASISASYGLLGSIALAASAFLVLTINVIPWHPIFNSSSPETNQVAVLSLGLFLLNVPLGLIQKIQYALQEVMLSNVIMTAGPVLAILGVVTCRMLGFGPLTVIVAASGGPSLALIGATILTFRRHAEVRPRLGDMDWRSARSLAALGSAFMAVQILSSTSLNADNFIVAHLAGAKSVADYSIAARLFSIVGLLISMMNLPLWPANAEALARGDVDWVRKTTWKMVYLGTLAMIAAGGVLVIGGDRLIRAWVGDSVQVSPLMLAGFAVFWSLVAACSPFFMVQNAKGILRPQLLAWGLFLGASIPLKVLFARHTTDLLPWVAAALYMVIMAPAAWIGYARSIQGELANGGEHEPIAPVV